MHGKIYQRLVCTPADIKVTEQNIGAEVHEYFVNNIVLIYMTKEKLISVSVSLDIEKDGKFSPASASSAGPLNSVFNGQIAQEHASGFPSSFFLL